MTAGVLQDLAAPVPDGFIPTIGLLGHVLASPGRVVPTVHHPEPCRLARAAVDAARLHPAGGLIKCEHDGCDRCVFIAPATCLERVEDDLDEIDGGVVARRP